MLGSDEIRYQYVYSMVITTEITATVYMHVVM